MGVFMSTHPPKRVLLINRDVVELGRWKQYVLTKDQEVEVYSADSVTLEELQYIHPDLIVLGRTSTGSDDEYSEVLRNYLTVGPTKVLVVMAWAQLDDLERAVQFGADDVLATPFSPKEFIHRIDALLLT
jgi:DNA-binding response OmpR family regulator